MAEVTIMMSSFHAIAVRMWGGRPDGIKKIYIKTDTYSESLPTE